MLGIGMDHLRKLQEQERQERLRERQRRKLQKWANEAKARVASKSGQTDQTGSDELTGSGTGSGTVASDAEPPRMVTVDAALLKAALERKRSQTPDSIAGIGVRTGSITLSPKRSISNKEQLNRKQSLAKQKLSLGSRK